jgi:hypothetical protein
VIAQGDVVRVGGVATVVEDIEPRRDWKGRDLGCWIDAVVLRFPNGRRLRFKKGIVEESPRFQVESRLFS